MKAWDVGSQGSLRVRAKAKRGAVFSRMGRLLAGGLVATAIAAGGLTLASSPAGAQTAAAYYVDTTGTDVNNTTCAQADPCASISHAVSVAQGATNGGTIEVGPGTFDDAVTVPSSGSFTIAGIPGETTLEGSHASDLCEVTFVAICDLGATLTVSGLDIVSDELDIYDESNSGSLTVVDDTMSAALVDVYAGGSGAVTLDQSTLGSLGGASEGVYASGTGTVAIDRSTISGALDGVAAENATVTVENSTISGNADDGIFEDATATVVVDFSTISDNAEEGIYNPSDGSASARGSVFAGNGTNCYGPVSDYGYNVDSGTSCGFSSTGSVTGTDPNLGPLEDNGGPTETQAILPSSAAYHIVPAPLCPATDERGEARPQPANSYSCDAGAFEYSPPTSISITSPPLSGRDATTPNIGPVVVTALDSSGNPATSASPIVLGLSSTDPSTVFGLTKNGATTSAVDIPPGSTTGSFFVGSSQPGQVPVTVSSSLGSAGQTETVTPGPAETITITGGDNQSATPTAQFADPLSVNVTDSLGNPVPGATVDFSAGGVTGGPSFDGSNTTSAVTDQNGNASVVLTAGTLAGTYHVLTNMLGPSALPAAYLTETVVPGPPASITKIAGDLQSTVPDSQFANLLEVSVTDSWGNPITGDQVRFTVASGDAAFPSAVDETATAGGDATSESLHSGPVAGPVTVTATEAQSGLSTTFNETIVHGAPSTLSIVGGNDQSTQVTEQFPSAPSVQLEDAEHNPVPHVSVTFDITSGSATFAGGGSQAVVSTGTDGTATAPALIAGDVSGPVTITAEDTTDSISSPGFTETVLPGPPSTITLTQGGNQQAGADQNFATSLVAQVTDQFNNVIPNETVVFGVVSGSASFPTGVSSVEATTDATGTATAPVLQAGPVAGPVDVAATVYDTTVTTASSGLVVVPGPAAALEVVPASAGESAQPGQPFSVDPAVEVTDAYGNAVSGVPVGFTVTTGSASLPSGGSATSGSSGAASVPLTAGPKAGPVTLVVTSGLLPSATIDETVVPGPAAKLFRGGSGQVATSDTAFDRRLTATVTDAEGNGVSGVKVTFAVTSGSASFTGGGKAATTMTAAGGVATAPVLDAGPVAGAVTVRVTSTGLRRALIREEVVRVGNGDAMVAPNPSGRGYWVVTGTGHVTAFGGAKSYGSLRRKLTAPVIGIVAARGGEGYWLFAADGGVFAFGDARFMGSTGHEHIPSPVVGMAVLPSGSGYLLVSASGTTYRFGTARTFREHSGGKATQPIVGIAYTPDGKGYLLATSTGQVLAFGDAATYARHGAAPKGTVVGLAATPDGKGYWLATQSGQVVAFGDAGYYGEGSSKTVRSPVVGIAATRDGKGYWLVTSRNALLAFGDAR